MKPIPVPVPVGILSRVSTAPQVTKVSLSQQEEAGRQRAEMLASELGAPVEVVAVYRDGGISGDGRDREALSLALEDVKAGKIRYLIVYDVDRLSREPAQSAAALRACVLARARLVFCNKMEMRYDEETGELDITDELLFYIRSVFAKKELKDILGRTQRGRIGLVEKGIQTQRGRAPYGYGIWLHWQAKAGLCQESDIGLYYVKEEESAIAYDIFEKIADGTFSLRGLARYLETERGLVSPGESATWYATTIRRIIADPVYKGEAHYGVQSRRRGPKYDDRGNLLPRDVKNDPSKWHVLPAPPIVSPELWQAANDRLSTNRTALAGNPTSRYLWSGILRCPDCGASLCGFGGFRGTLGRRYYVCSRYRSNQDTRAKNDPAILPCGYLHAVQEKVIEERAAKALQFAATRPEVIETLVREWMQDRAKKASQAADGPAAKGKLQASRDTVLRRQSALTRSLVMATEDEADASTLADLRSQIRQTSLQIADIDTQMSRLPQSEKLSDLLPDPKTAAENVRALLETIPSVLASDLLSIAEKRHLLHLSVKVAHPILPENLRREIEENPEAASKHRGRRIEWGCEVILNPEIWRGSGAGKRQARGNCRRHPDACDNCLKPTDRNTPSLRIVATAEGVTCHVG